MKYLLVFLPVLITDALCLQAVQPSVGNMAYDEFVAMLSCPSELETRLAHFQPAEILYPKNSLPAAVDNLLKEWKKQR